MELSKQFDHTKFSVRTISDIRKMLADRYPLDQTLGQDDYTLPDRYDESLDVALPNSSWSHDSFEEWASDYSRDDAVSGSYSWLKSYGNAPYLRINFRGYATEIRVSARTRAEVLELMQRFEYAAPSNNIPESPYEFTTPTEPPIRVFLGHGRSGDWRIVKDDLVDKHGYQVDAFEVGARAGHVVRDILDQMLAVSSFAVMVLTGEDATADDGMRARQNVVHELGLFQGRLGFSRAIAIVEDGVELFSNMDGIQHISYQAGHVESSVGDILATLRREFGDRR